MVNKKTIIKPVRFRAEQVEKVNRLVSVRRSANPNDTTTFSVAARTGLDMWYENETKAK